MRPVFCNYDNLHLLVLRVAVRELPVRHKEPESLSLHIRGFDYHHVCDLNRVRGQPDRRLFRFNGDPHYDFGHLVGSKGLS